MQGESCHDLAEIDMPTQLEGDESLFKALVVGCHVGNAAAIAGLSERTVYRRLADPEFRRRLDEARQSLRESILAKLSDAGHDAISVLTELMHGSTDDSVRLKAAKAVLDSLLATQRTSTAVAQSMSSSVATVAVRVEQTGENAAQSISPQRNSPL